VIVDLHSHYPMHLLAGSPDAGGLMMSHARPSLGDKLRAMVLRLANTVANYPKGDKPAVTSASLAQSNVRVALSVLYAPFDEIDLGERYGAPPRPRYFSDLVRQLDAVEARVAMQPTLVGVARDHDELEAAMTADRVALVHAVEGGFHLGDTAKAVRANVETLASRGVAYITVAHLFWRQVATNAPGVPFLPDWVYTTLFPQPEIGLPPLGQALIAAMLDHRILIDVTHMSARSIDETLHLLDQHDPNGAVPLLATHSACKALTRAQYNLSDEHIAAIARRRGVIGLIACRHWMAMGMPAPKTIGDTMDVICRHIDHIESVVQGVDTDLDGDHLFTAFGSDQDGFIKPSLPGLETPAGFAQVEAELTKRYGAVAAERICSGNALRVLGYWGR
jgi:microsomal dipeptidase-like Zn-dependent dipeptidase